MGEELRHHLPIVIVTSIVGIITGTFALLYIHDNAANMDVGAFSTYIIIIPCIVMLICSIIITITAQAIGRQLYLIVIGICLVTGLISMIATSIWIGDPQISAALLANSPDAEAITPPVESPIIVLRNIAAYIVVPTVGCIAGAWIGSRLHPMHKE